VVRYLWPCPGQLLHMDTKRLGRFEQPGHAVTGDRARRSRRVGFEYVHSIVDDCSRLAYSEIADDERAGTVTAFTERALDFFADHGVVCERLMTDNAFAYIHNRGPPSATAPHSPAFGRSPGSTPSQGRHGTERRASGERSEPPLRVWRDLSVWRDL
jgi:hypothetical protein